MFNVLSGFQTGELSHESNHHECMPEIEDEWLYDEVGKRLNQMVPVPVSSYDYIDRWDLFFHLNQNYVLLL